jgi:hypothetical protein
MLILEPDQRALNRENYAAARRIRQVLECGGFIAAFPFSSGRRRPSRTGAAREDNVPCPKELSI